MFILKNILDDVEFNDKNFVSIILIILDKHDMSE